MPALVLFDIDGTILRLRQPFSREIFAGIMKDLFDKHINPETLPSFAGATDLSILRAMAEENNASFDEIQKNLPEIWAKILKVFKKYCTPDHIEILPGVSKLIIEIAKAPDMQLGLLTGNFRDNAYQKLRSYHLDIFFPFGAFGDDDEDRNKLPEIALLRANAHAGRDDYSHSNAIIVGDSHRDVECAKENGLPVLAVATGHLNLEELKGLNPDSLFEDLIDTDRVLKSIRELTNN